MRLSQPKKNTWYISLVIGIIAAVLFILSFFIAIPYIELWVIAFILLLVAWLLLVLSTAMKGL